MWWSKEAVEKFKERAQCFVEQYSQYELFGISVSIIPFSWKVNIYKIIPLCNFILLRSMEIKHLEKILQTMVESEQAMM